MTNRGVKGGFVVCLWSCLAGIGSLSGAHFEGTGTINYAGYSGCIVLENKDARVVLDPNCGGRVLEYAWKGDNVIWLNPKEDGWLYGGPGAASIDPGGGRFDIGPEQVIPAHPVLFLGRWKADITGPRSARLISEKDPVVGVQVVREFRLDKKTSRLRCTQTIRNVSAETKHWFHWSRTLAVGGGICVVPLNPASRFPKGYIYYGPGGSILYRPAEQPNVRIREGFLEITGVPVQPKFGFDSYAGWFCYLTRGNLLFVKRFPVYPERVYGEMAAITVSIFYTDRLCELEPIGPRENIAPGGAVSFTEDWWILPYPFPEGPGQLDLKGLQIFVERNARP